MTFTFAQLKAEPEATLVVWLEISGIPYAFSNGAITETNKATLFGDPITPARTFYSGIQDQDLSFSKSIELLSGKGTTGGFSVKLLDFETATHLDGFLTWLFGYARTTIARSRLTADVTKHVGGAGHDWTVEDNTVFGAAGAFSDPLYCGLETVAPASLNADTVTLDDVDRSEYESPCIAHRADRSGLYPWVTDHPTQWHGRLVRLFVTYMDGAGDIASDTGLSINARSSAHQIVGVLRDVSFTSEGVWELRCDGVDTLLNREMMRGAPEADISRRIRVYSATDDVGVLPGTTAPVAVVSQITAAAAFEAFWIELATPDAFYTPSEFIDAFNVGARAPTSISGGAFLGMLTASLEGNDIVFRYETDNATVCWCQLLWQVPINAWREFDNTAFYWRQLGFPADTRNPIELTNGGFGAVSTTYMNVIGIDQQGIALDLKSGWEKTILLQSHPEFTAASWAADDWAVVISDEGVTLCRVISISGADNTVTIKVHLGEPRIRHYMGVDKPAKFRKCIYAYPGLANDDHRLAHPVLTVLLSTGVGAFNHDSYDCLDEGLGIELPHETPSASGDSYSSVIDVESFERFFDEAAAYVEDITDVIYEPTKVLDWLTARLAFLGGYLVVNDGRLAVQRGLTPLWSRTDHTITEGEMLPTRSLSFGDAAMVEAVKYSHRWDRHGERFMLVEEYVRGDAQSDVADKTVAFEDKGIRLREGAGYDMAMEVLSEFLDEGSRYRVQLDRALIDIEPGQVVGFSDEGTGDDTDDSRLYKGLPNPDGTRGFSSGTAKMIVLDASASQEEQTTDATLLLVRRKRSGYSASAWISSWADAGGQTTLTCDTNVFRHADDGPDVGAFSVGDKVRVISINPTQADGGAGVDHIENQETGLTIDSINEAADTITLTATLALAWPSPPASASQLMVLVHDEYATANQTTEAKLWCHVGDSGVIDSTTDEAYEW